jgi:glutathione S-transferase
MPKQIVFCADGTWNGPSDDATTTDIDGTAQSDTAIRDGDTNVVKLFENLEGQETGTQALQDETEVMHHDAAGALVQAAKYIHGVGDTANPIMKVLGGVFGAGVVARIIRGYTFISREYEAGDSIHIAGFSRGAYTARALAGMISAVGLLDPSKYDTQDKSEAYLRGFAAWLKCKGIVFKGDKKLSSLLNTIMDLAGDVVARTTLRKGALIPRVPIKSVGVWDTVGSMGIPNYVKGSRSDFFSFVDTKLSRAVEFGFHAMALDEQRRDFPVTRWDKDARVEQVWFIGAHSDVGGGYPIAESGLSNLALDWMTLKLAGVGVRFVELPAGPLDPARFGQAFHTPWKKPPFNIGAKQRAPKRGDVFHESVSSRWQADAAYRKLWPKIF